MVIVMMTVRMVMMVMMVTMTMLTTAERTSSPHPFSKQCPYPHPTLFCRHTSQTSKFSRVCRLAFGFSVVLFAATAAVDDAEAASLSLSSSISSLFFFLSLSLCLSISSLAIFLSLYIHIPYILLLLLLLFDVGTPFPRCGGVSLPDHFPLPSGK